MKSGKPLSNPLPSYVQMSSTDCCNSNDEKVEMAKVPFAYVVGSLMYAMIATHPDITFIVGVVSRCMSNPSKNIGGQ